VHGRGQGVRRAEVRRALAGRADVLDFRDAPPAAGGWGATLVRLAPREAE
jgi:DNA-nicking Smr family endonuclease